MNRYFHVWVALFFACSPVKGRPLIDATDITVESMQIMPAPIPTRVLGIDATLPLTVMATLSDGTMRDVTAYVTWSSSDESVATVPFGDLRESGAGSASIIAMLDGSMATANVVVRDPVLAVASQANGSNGPGIDFFDVFGSGNIAPLRSIRGAKTKVGAIFTLFADVASNELYVADESVGVLVFPLDGSGNIAPLRTIPEGSASTLQAMLAVALYEKELYVVGETSNQIGEIAVFDPQSDGSATTPTRLIVGSADNSVTELSTTISALAIHDDLIYVGDVGSAHITTYPTTGSGEIAPTTIFAGSASGIFEPIGMGFRGDELFIADVARNAIEVYSLAGGSDITPTRRIIGPDTHMQTPTGLSLVGQTIVCAQNAGSTVETYPIEALEDQPPTTTLTGSNTLISAPIGMTAF